jgi:UMF1 family MFS transporter
MNKKNIFLWALYDFANSLVMIAFFLYFSQWLVVERGASDLFFNMMLVLSSAVFLVVAPVLGQIISKVGARMPGLRITTAVAATGYLGTGLITLFFPTHFILAGVCFALTTSIYLLSFVFYSPLMTELSDESNRGRVSSYGQMGNWLGQILGILFVLPFATGKLYLFGAEGRAQAFIPAVIVFVLCALPMLVWFKEKAQKVSVKISITEEYKHFWTTTKVIFGTGGLGLFFLSYFLFSDAVLTFSNNFPIFLEKVFSATDSTKSLLSAGILTFSVFGAYVFGKIADRVGHKKTLVSILIGWVILLPIIAMAPDTKVLSVVCLIAGIFFGAVWTVTRSMLVYLTPPDKINISFTYYILAERFATLVGPATYGLIVSATAVYGVMSYRFAILSMSILVLAGLFVTLKIPSDRK